MHTSRAVLYDKYGRIDVLHVGEIQLPSPSSGEVLVKVHASALNPKDALVRKGRFAWLTGSRFPKIVGLDFSGTVAEVGKGVELAVGTPVYGSLNELTSRRGTLADYVLIKQHECAPMPNALSFEQAAALPLAAQTSLQALRNLIHLEKGQRILILGASGGVGVYAIQIAKAIGAHVTTTSSAKNQNFCRELGADVVLDYAADNPFNEQYDGIFDAFGNQTFDMARPALKSKGTYVNTVPSKRLFLDAFLTLFSSQRARFVLIRSNTPDLKEIAQMVEQGLVKPVIDQVFDFEQFSPAFAHLETRHARGKIVLSIK
ncbi:MAG: NAD(P)-dependent alcohol dehydrogenase [Parachlamydia sp.]|nr:NAD(P)-dependent alcohol dehydrogenase [Parachlamydia sp.]